VPVDPNVVTEPVEVTLSNYATSFPATNQRLSPPQVEALIEAHNTLAMSLFLHRCAPATIPAENCVIAPNAIAKSLSMLALGAEGPSRDSLLNSLGLSVVADTTPGYYGLLDVVDGSSAGPSLASGRFSADASFWGQTGLLFGKQFLDDLTSEFSAELHEADFARAATQAASDLNRWQSLATGSLFGAIAEVDDKTRLAITNTDYFSSTWPIALPSAPERSGTFREDIIMTFEQLDGVYDVVQTSEYNAFRLPLASSKDLVFVMPTGAPFSQIASDLSAQWVSSLVSTMAPQGITFFVPTLQAWNSVGMDSYLSSDGAAEIFDPQKADFSGISRSAGFYPNKTVHESRIGFSAHGVTAGSVNFFSFRKPVTDTSAAVDVDFTGVGNRPPCAPWNLAPNEFVMNQPFLFLLRDQGTGVLLYAGQFVRPDEPPLCNP
jgi:serpin B